jgi:hypothetical protein
MAKRDYQRENDEAWAKRVKSGLSPETKAFLGRLNKGDVADAEKRIARFEAMHKRMKNNRAYDKEAGKKQLRYAKKDLRTVKRENTNKPETAKAAAAKTYLRELNEPKAFTPRKTAITRMIEGFKGGAGRGGRGGLGALRGGGAGYPRVR